MFPFVPDPEPPEVLPSRRNQPSLANWSTALLTSSMICLTGPGVKAQSECTTERDTFDPFTKCRTLTVAPASSSVRPFYRWIAVNQDLSLEITWQQAGVHANVVLEGYALMLMLENDSIITLSSLNTVTGAHDKDSAGIDRTTGTYSYAISPVEAAMLRQYWVKRVRIYFYEGYQEFDAEKLPAWQHTMAHTVSCFMDQLAKDVRPKAVLAGRTAEGTPPGTTRMR